MTENGKNEMNELREELDDLLDGFVPDEDPDLENEDEEEVEEETETEDAEEEGEDLEEEGVEDSEGDEGDEEDSEEESEEVEDEEGDDGDDDSDARLNALIEQNKQLMEKINQLTAKPEDKPKDEPEDNRPKSVEDLLGEMDPLELAQDRNTFVGFMQNVLALAQEQAFERMLVNIPQVVTSQIRQKQTIDEAVENFYNENEDLVPVKKVVSMVTNEVVAEDPNKSLEEVLNESAKRVRAMLGLQKKAKTKSKGGDSERKTGKTKSRKPALIKNARGKKRVKPKLTGLQKEIQDLL